MESLEPRLRTAPPKADVFYATLKKGRSLPWAERALPEALGITHDAFTTILAKADEFILSEGALVLTDGVDRAVRDAAVNRLRADASTKAYFQHSISAQEFPHAHKFFQDAAHRFVMIANDARRGRAPGRSATGRNGRAVAIGSKRGRDEDEDEKDNSLQRMPSTLPKRQKMGIPPATPKEPVKPKPRNVQECDASSFYIFEKAAQPNTLEVMSLEDGRSSPASMPALFRTQGTPRPSDLTLWVVCPAYLVIRADRGIPQKFKFFWIEDGVGMQMEVSDDASLREAYKIWLVAGDVDLPFVLCVDEASMDCAWFVGW